MFGFKKKVDVVEIHAPVSGELIALSKTKDAVFSTGAMGQGFAIEPNANEIISPFDGKISVVAETKHAIGMTTSDGLEVLLHLGIDTVELGGSPFVVPVKVGDKVKVGQRLVLMDRQKIQGNGLLATVMVVITNSNDKLESLDVEEKKYAVGEIVGTLKLKN
ncbi:MULTISPECIES: PTS glucose transporter subunit IIA [Lactobacillaceae]|uniref:PTS sugar transporter subunit IIA n=1 Tax=Liquorilactobacillus sp. TaxID=2767923 RepID=UPI0025B2124C|nr:PTS glucose transporter subunit IIA [Lactobacillus sp. UCMA15818]MDN2453166.1 PTS glucose transporter subunit IIA [Lactobacillus sp. UCMA15818]